MTPETFHLRMVERADQCITSTFRHIKSLIERFERSPDDHDLPVTLAAKSAELAAAVAYRQSLEEAGALLSPQH